MEILGCVFCFKDSFSEEFLCWFRFVQAEESANRKGSKIDTQKVQVAVWDPRRSTVLDNDDDDESSAQEDL